MKKIWILAVDSFLENIWNRIFVLVAIFGGILVYASLLFGVLAVEQELRVLMDSGLALIEMVTLIAGIYFSATLFLREIETKTIYLVLSRPLSRLEYLLGRVLGLILSLLFIMVLMSFIHLILLFVHHWSWRNSYLLSLAAIFLKALMLIAAAVFFSLFSTSTIAAIVFSGSLWVLGNFTQEIRFLTQKESGLPALLSRLLLFLFPHFEILNWQGGGNETRVLMGASYAAVYFLIFLALSWLVLRAKEF